MNSGMGSKRSPRRGICVCQSLLPKSTSVEKAAIYHPCYGYSSSMTFDDEPRARRVICASAPCSSSMTTQWSYGSLPTCWETLVGTYEPQATERKPLRRSSEIIELKC